MLFDYDDNHVDFYAWFVQGCDNTDCCVIQMLLCIVDYFESCVMVCHHVLSLCVSCDHGVVIDLKVCCNVEYSFVIAHLLGLDYQMGAFES